MAARPLLALLIGPLWPVNNLTSFFPIPQSASAWRCLGMVGAVELVNQATQRFLKESQGLGLG